MNKKKPNLTLVKLIYLLPRGLIYTQTLYNIIYLRKIIIQINKHARLTNSNRYIIHYYYFNLQQLTTFFIIQFIFFWTDGAAVVFLTSLLPTFLVNFPKIFFHKNLVLTITNTTKRNQQIVSVVFPVSVVAENPLQFYIVVQITQQPIYYNTLLLF